MRSRKPILLLVLAPLTLCSIGCESAETVDPRDEAAIAELLAEYLPRLGSAYSEGDLTILQDLAAEKEIARLHKTISDLMNLEGRVVEPTLRSFNVEQITIWNYANAFVTTLEVWDLKVLAAGSEQVLSQVEGQRNRVRYQLKRRDHGWQVIYRTIETTFE